MWLAARSLLLQSSTPWQLDSHRILCSDASHISQCLPPQGCGWNVYPLLLKQTTSVILSNCRRCRRAFLASSTTFHNAFASQRKPSLPHATVGATMLVLEDLEARSSHAMALRIIISLGVLKSVFVRWVVGCWWHMCGILASLPEKSHVLGIS